MALATAPTTDAERTHRRARAAWSTAFGATNVAPVPTAIAVSGDTIYLGGSFINPMAGMPEFTYNRIARWDGSGWHRMGEGVDSAVHAIAVVGNDVYVGGEFSVAGGTVRAPGLARWDGAKWAPVAGGIEGSEVDEGQGQQQSRVQSSSEGVNPGKAAGDDRSVYDL